MKKEEILQALEQIKSLQMMGIFTASEAEQKRRPLEERLGVLEKEGSVPSSGAFEGIGADIFSTGGGAWSGSSAPSASPLAGDSLLSQASKNPPSPVASGASDILVAGGHSGALGSDVFGTALGPGVSSSAPSLASDALPTAFGETGTSASLEAPKAAEGKERIGLRYEIVKLLGRGGMGEVLLALDTQEKREVALKVLHPNFGGMAKELFVQEIQNLQKLKHPGIVQFRALEKDTQRGFFFVMEYVDGDDLSRRLGKIEERDGHRGLEVSEILAILGPLSEALDFAHRQGMLHLDIKPANVLIGRKDGGIRLIDFGIARMRSGSSHPAGMGTVYYMAPEQLSGDGEITGATDLYALGVMAYQMLTGRIFQGGMPGPSKLRPGLSEEIDAIHEKTVAFRPADRFLRPKVWFEAFARALQIQPSSPETKKDSSEGGSLFVLPLPIFLRGEPKEDKDQDGPSTKEKKPSKAPEATLSERFWSQIKEKSEAKRPFWLETGVARKAAKLTPGSKVIGQAPGLSEAPIQEGSWILEDRRGAVLLEMVFCPGGRFKMGAEGKEKLARRQEKPAVDVEVSGFWMARSPVTNRAWSWFLDQSGYKPHPSEENSDYLTGWKDGRCPPEALGLPATGISCRQAWIFCDFYGVALPSEAQWESFARKQGWRPSLQVWTADAYDMMALRQLRGLDPCLRSRERADFLSIRGVADPALTDAALFRRDSAPADACLPTLGFLPCLDWNKGPSPS